MSKRLNRFFSHAQVPVEPNQEMLVMADWTPSVDISETDTAYLIKGEVPGAKKEDVKVILQGRMLTISGERQMEKEDKDKKFFIVLSVATAVSCAAFVCLKMLTSPL